MAQGSYREDPLTPGERDEYEADLISFCDRELDPLGGIAGQNVLYAGGASLLWLEGLGQRIGPEGHLTALDADPQRIEHAQSVLAEANIPAPVQLVVGGVFEPPFQARSFDLVYSAGLFHELDVSERPAEAALVALASVLKPGGRLATSDFVDSVDAVQLEDEALDREVALANTGAKLYGIHDPESLVGLHERSLSEVRWRVLPPYRIRHLDKVVLDEDEPARIKGLTEAARRGPRERRLTLLERARREGYTRPATVYVEGGAPRVEIPA